MWVFFFFNIYIKYNNCFGQKKKKKAEGSVSGLDPAHRLPSASSSSVDGNHQPQCQLGDKSILSLGLCLLICKTTGVP